MDFRLPTLSLCTLALFLPSMSFTDSIWFASGPSETKNTQKKNKNTGDVLTAPKMPSKEFWEAALTLGAGYRNDSIKFTYHPPKSAIDEQIVTLKYTDLSSVMEVLRLDARVWNFLFNLEGDYAPLVSGHLATHYESQYGQKNPLDYTNRKLSGYSADASASIGYRYECNPSSDTIFAIIPQVGYSYSHQSYETDSRSHFFFVPLQLETFQQDQAPYQQDWFGPYLEAKFSLSFKDKVFLQPFYQYHFLTFRAVKNFITTIPIVSSEFSWHAVTKGNSGWGQIAGADLFYQSPNRWRMGWKGYWMGYNSGHSKAHVNRVFSKYSTVPPSHLKDILIERLNTRWNNYSIYMYAGYDF